MDPGAAQDLIPRYHHALDFEALWREFPPPPDYFSATYRLSRDEMRGMQEQRFLRQMERAWQVPFYRRHWSAVGMEPGDIRGLEDLASIPPFSVHDMRERRERQSAMGGLYRHRSGRACAVAVDPADQRRNDVLGHDDDVERGRDSPIAILRRTLSRILLSTDGSTTR